MTATLAVDLGGTNMRCAVVDDAGGLHDRQELPTPHDGTGPSALVQLMRAVTDDVSCGRAVIGVPGRVNYRLGALEHAPNLAPSWLPALTETGLAAALGIPVALANDADLAAVGEATRGAGRPYADVAYLTLSTGVGAGVVLGGLLVHGRRSLAELGHTVIALDRLAQGQPATLEDLASGTALGRLAAAAGVGPLGRDVITQMQAGDAEAARVWAAVVDAAAVGVVNLAWTFSPDVVVIGGGLGLVGDVLLDPLRVAIGRDGPPAVDPPIAVVPALLGDDAGLMGAAGWAAAFVPEAAGRAGGARAAAPAGARAAVRAGASDLDGAGAFDGARA